MSRNLGWMDKAACVGEDPELFFPKSDGEFGRRQRERAAAVCAGCPVQIECDQHRVQTGASTGVWGAEYRNTIDPASKRIPKISHGSDWGYHQHLKYNVDVCDRCRTAHTYANRKWPKKR